MMQKPSGLLILLLIAAIMLMPLDALQTGLNPR
jgi:hypothetical protein